MTSITQMQGCLLKYFWSSCFVCYGYPKVSLKKHELHSFFLSFFQVSTSNHVAFKSVYQQYNLNHINHIYDLVYIINSCVHKTCSEPATQLRTTDTSWTHYKPIFSAYKISNHVTCLLLSIALHTPGHKNFQPIINRSITQNLMLNCRQLPIFSCCTWKSLM